MKQTTQAPRASIVTCAIACILGMVLSIYAYHVETSIHSDPNFRALCDISEKMSCTKVFSSRYGTGFGIMEHIIGKDSIGNQPNSVYGMIFYIILAALAFKMTYSLVIVQLIAAIFGGLGSIYLAVILVFVLEDLCVVCVSTYIVNVVVIVCSVMKFKAVQNIRASKKEKNEKKKAC